MDKQVNKYSDSIITLMGFCLGLVIMLVAVQVFIVNSYDFNNIKSGVQYILRGSNPWEGGVRHVEFYNPPFSIIFLWPILFINSKAAIVIGGALLFAFAFLKRAWVGLAWFATNSVLWQIANGGIDMLVIGAGLLLLEWGDRLLQHKLGVFIRTIAFGFLLIKPQGGIFIVAFYILLRRDWKGFVLTLILLGFVFIRYWPGWLAVILNDPPAAQQVAPQTINGRFGLVASLVIALFVTIARPWNYWQLGGALAVILPPYGMPGIPVFLTLGSVKRLSAVVMVVVFSAGMAAMTWIAPPEGTQDYYVKLGQFMSIYHLSIIGLAVILATISPFWDPNEKAGIIDLGNKTKQMIRKT
jgi:hypothetical protein